MTIIDAALLFLTAANRSLLYFCNEFLKEFHLTKEEKKTKSE